MVHRPWVGLSSWNYIKKWGRTTLWLYYKFARYAHNSRRFYKILGQNLGFKPQNMPWGDSMPNKPLTQTSWLALESLCQRRDLHAESLQLYLNYCKVNNALGDCLLDCLDALFRYHGVGTTSLRMCLCPLHLCKLAFNCWCDGEGLIDPRLNAHLQDCFFVPCLFHLFFQCFGLLHSCEPLSEGHRLCSSFDIVILLLEFSCLYSKR